MERVRLAKAVTLEATSHTNMMVVTDQAGLILVEPRLEVARRHKFRAANGVTEVGYLRPFKFFISNFGS